MAPRSDSLSSELTGACVTDLNIREFIDRSLARKLFQLMRTDREAVSVARTLVAWSEDGEVTIGRLTHALGVSAD